jgi:hypothetical protein
MIQGARVIEINEENPWEYSTYNLTSSQLSQEDGSLLGYGDDRTKLDYTISIYFEKILNILLGIFKDMFFNATVA